SRARQSRRGRAELLDNWSQAFARRSSTFSLRMLPTLHGIRLLSGDLALVDGDLDYSAGVGANGHAQDRTSQPFTAVMARHGASWLVLSIRAGAASPIAKP